MLNSVASESNTKTVLPASKLSAWCDRLIECGWLSAIIVVPLFFNIYSSRVFEPDKLTTLRSIALFMATFWLIKWFEERNNPNRDTAIHWRTPLVIPTLIMVSVYIISTALSVAPRTSLLGSYQRLQGTYTHFSYIVVFFMVLQGLRTRAQLDRLVTLLILNSLPIAMYGMLQRYGLDPLPWGGDTTERVAGNMGNAIFIAAYLIMAFFLTLNRIVESFVSVLTADRAKLSDVIRAACYILIALLNALVVLVLAGSRGPQLGWLAGMFFSVLLMAQLIRKRTLRAGLTVGGIGLAAAGLAFLVLLNTSDAAFFTSVRKLPFFGRLGTAFNTTDGTNLVRVLIWKGAVNLVLPHAPIESPTLQSDGTTKLQPDAFNALRPLFGYGPESMYVSYNRFYEPGLANVEARNASPDRSHNETWDSLVITGGVGFLAYMLVFGSVFYYGFLWIGFIRSRFEKLLFPALWVAGGVAGAVLVAGVRPELFGVAVAAGILAGIIVFMVISSLLNLLRRADEAETKLSLRDRLLVIGILATVIAHFVEIHTGIAIAATRSHFWILSAVMIVIGAGLLKRTANESVHEEVSTLDLAPAAETSPKKVEPEPTTGSAASRRKRRAAAQSANARTPGATSFSRGLGLPDWFSTVAAYGLFLGLILSVMAFDFTNNSARVDVPGRVFIESMTLVKGTAKLGILSMFVLTLGVGLAIVLAELRREGKLRSKDQVLAALGIMASISIFMWVAFGTFIAKRLVDFVTTQASSVDTILGIGEQLASFPAYVYVLIALVMVIGASLLRNEEGYTPNKTLASVPSFAVGVVVGIISLITINTSNLQPIAADIVYKQANPWDAQGGQTLQAGTNVQGWDLAIEHYRRAIELAPNEDFYYLWLGRALLEKGKATQAKTAAETIKPTDSFENVIGSQWGRTTVMQLPSALKYGQDDLFNAAEIILREARVINPLNTDHSANLSRMFRQIGDLTQDPAKKQQRYQRALSEYAMATYLSPQNAQLLNEWGTLYFYGMGDPVKAQEKLDQSVKIDQKFDQTYLIRGDLQLQQARNLEVAYQQANQTLAAVPVTDTIKFNAAKSAAETAKNTWFAQLKKAETEFENVIRLNPNNAQGLTVLADIQLKLGDTTKAIGLLEQIAAKNPTDWNTQKNLALLYRDNKQLDKAKAAAQRALQLAPQDQQAGLQTLVQQLGQ